MYINKTNHFSYSQYNHETFLNVIFLKIEFRTAFSFCIFVFHMGSIILYIYTYIYISIYIYIYIFIYTSYGKTEIFCYNQ